MLMRQQTPIGPLLKTVFESIFEVFLLCLAGYILARKGILDRPTQKKLNRLNVSLFTPALLFSKVAFFLNPAKLRELWIIPIVFIVTTTISMTVAFTLGWAFQLKRSQRSFAIASAMFMNSNSLPIALMQSLVVTVPGLKWDDDDNRDAMVGRALTYLVLYSTLGMIVRWSYGVRLLSHADPEGTDAPVQGEATDSQHEGALDSETGTPTEVECPTITVNGVGHTDPKFFYSFPNSPSRLSNNLPQASSSSVSLAHDIDDDNEDDEDTIEIRRRRRNPITPSSSPFQARVRRIRHRVKKALKNLNEFMTVPLWAALASLLVACIRPVQHVLEEHMEWFKGALNQAGDVSIPLTLVVLGAYFYTPLTEEEKLERSRRALPRHADDEEEARGRSISTTVSQMSLVDNVREMFKLAPRRKNSEERRRQKEKSRPGETKTVIIAILSRMVITPLFLLPLMAIGAKWDFQEVFADPIFVVSNVLLISSPPALTLAQITQAASGDAFERLISRTIFWSYCVVTPPSTIICVVVGLILSKL